MRPTVTLDPDVAAALQRTARERGVSFKQVLNDAVMAWVGSDTDFSRFPGLRWRDPFRS